MRESPVSPASISRDPPAPHRESGAKPRRTAKKSPLLQVSSLHARHCGSAMRLQSAHSAEHTQPGCWPAAQGAKVCQGMPSHLSFFPRLSSCCLVSSLSLASIWQVTGRDPSSYLFSPGLFFSKTPGQTAGLMDPLQFWAGCQASEG